MMKGRIVLGGLLVAACASAQDFSAKIDKADTTWVLVASVLVLLMTPALSLFYGGLVRYKNVLSTMMHSIVLMALLVAAEVSALARCPAGPRTAKALHEP